MGNLFSFVRRRSTVQNNFFKIFLSIALTNALSHSVLVKELNSSPVGMNYFFAIGLLFGPSHWLLVWGLTSSPVETKLGHQENFIFFQNGVSFLAFNVAVGKCKDCVVHWSTILITSRPVVAKSNPRPSGTRNFSPNGQEVKKYSGKGLHFGVLIYG